MWFITQDCNYFALETHKPAPCAVTESLLYDVQRFDIVLYEFKVTLSGRESFMNRAVQNSLELAARSALLSVMVEQSSIL